MIAVLGPGGVGGFLAAALARAGEPVTVVAREETAEVVRREGIAVDSVRLGRFTARPDTAARLTEPGAPLVVATKATTLTAALERVDAAPALVVPLLNGLDHMRLLREWFGSDRVRRARSGSRPTARRPRASARRAGSCASTWRRRRRPSQCSPARSSAPRCRPASSTPRRRSSGASSCG